MLTRPCWSHCHVQTSPCWSHCYVQTSPCWSHADTSMLESLPIQNQCILESLPRPNQSILEPVPLQLYHPVVLSHLVLFPLCGSGFWVQQNIILASAGLQSSVGEGAPTAWPGAVAGLLSNPSLWKPSRGFTAEPGPPAEEPVRLLDLHPGPVVITRRLKHTSIGLLAFSLQAHLIFAS